MSRGDVGRTMPGSAVLDLASRLAGAMTGLLVGDALGVPYEGDPPDRVGDVSFPNGGSRERPAGTWSDDGALALALLDSLLSAGFDPEDQGRRALAWFRDGAYTPDGAFGSGRTTRRALRALASGVPAIDAGPSDEQACGNGSLMRILPLALVHRDAAPTVLIELAHQASRVTHGHPRCQVACAVYCLLVQALLRGVPPEAALAEAMDTAEHVYGADRSTDGHRAALAELRAWPTRQGRGFVLDSFWSAWDAFAGGTDFEDAIRRAIAYGHDTDTTAAIAGGLAGARFGWEGIPLEWRRALRARALVARLVDGLVGDTGVRTSTASPLRVEDIPLADAPGLADARGRLGITLLPGKKRDGRTGPYWRDLPADIDRLTALGMDTLFLLVEDAELVRCLVPEMEREVVAAGRPTLIRFPIPDPHVPADLPAFQAAILDLVGRIWRGESVAIACRAGLDRSGMAAACLLREAGMDADAAIARVQAHRRGSITLRAQQGVVRAWRPTRSRRGAGHPVNPA